MKQEGRFRTRIGFYLAAMGSAFGLGNIWRFPYVVAENGGGAFVFLYVGIALLIGSACITAELILGRRTGSSAMVSLSAVPQKVGGARPGRRHLERLTRILGRLSLVALTLILAYYAVISSRVLYFLLQTGLGYIQPEGFDPDRALDTIRYNSPLQVGMIGAHILLVVFVLKQSVQSGFERWLSWLMPVFLTLMLVLLSRSISLPTAPEAFRFLFYPDFSKLGLGSLLEAIGHVCFTFSLGMGVLVTFGSYLNRSVHIPTAGFRVATLDTVFSLLTALLVFPLIIGGSYLLYGQDLLFRALPRLFTAIPGGSFYAWSFYFCLYGAALGVSLGLIEGLVANLSEWLGWSRRLAIWVAALAAFFLSLIPALSTTIFGGLRFWNRTLLELMDIVLINGLLPLTALGLSLFMLMKVSEQDVREEFEIEGQVSTGLLYRHWRLVMIGVVPALILLAYLLKLLSWL